jgi:hypothetical protein
MPLQSWKVEAAASIASTATNTVLQFNKGVSKASQILMGFYRAQSNAPGPRGCCWRIGHASDDSVRRTIDNQRERTCTWIASNRAR